MTDSLKLVHVSTSMNSCFGVPVVVRLCRSSLGCFVCNSVKLSPMDYASFGTPISISRVEGVSNHSSSSDM